MNNQNSAGSALKWFGFSKRGPIGPNKSNRLESASAELTSNLLFSTE
jgi:hypothetical protein